MGHGVHRGRPRRDAARPRIREARGEIPLTIAAGPGGPAASPSNPRKAWRRPSGWAIAGGDPKSSLGGPRTAHEVAGRPLGGAELHDSSFQKHEARRFSPGFAEKPPVGRRYSVVLPEAVRETS